MKLALYNEQVRTAPWIFMISSLCFCAGLVVTLRMFHGELDQVKKEEPVLLRGVNIVKKLGFPDVIMPGKNSHISPCHSFFACHVNSVITSANLQRKGKCAFAGDFRNDLYLTLCKGEFEKGSKTAGKNIEVHVIVVDKESTIIPVRAGASWSRLFR